MSNQSTLQFVPVSPVSHRDDPHTSALSAREVTRSGLRKRQAEDVLYLVQTFPDETSAELGDHQLAEAVGLDRYAIARRLPELADPANGVPFVERGPARECRVTGRKAITWRVTERGEGGEA